MAEGNIIILNGTSSSGKTTIAQALQDIMETPYLHTGIDQFLIERLPQRMITRSDGIAPATADGWLAEFRDGIVSQVRIGPAGYRWIKGMYQAVALLALEGLDIILDDVIYDQRVLQMAVRILPAQQVFFVGIRCPLKIAESREEARGDRAKGGAKAFFHLVHKPGIYDLEVDSASLNPIECAILIKTGLQARPTPCAFDQLRLMMPPA